MNLKKYYHYLILFYISTYSPGDDSQIPDSEVPSHLKIDFTAIDPDFVPLPENLISISLVFGLIFYNAFSAPEPDNPECCDLLFDLRTQALKLTEELSKEPMGEIGVIDHIMASIEPYCANLYPDQTYIEKYSKTVATADDFIHLCSNRKFNKKQSILNEIGKIICFPTYLEETPEATEESIRESITGIQFFAGQLNKLLRSITRETTQNLPCEPYINPKLYQDIMENTRNNAFQHETQQAIRNLETTLSQNYPGEDELRVINFEISTLISRIDLDRILMETNPAGHIHTMIDTLKGLALFIANLEIEKKGITTKKVVNITFSEEDLDFSPQITSWEITNFMKTFRVFGKHYSEYQRLKALKQCCAGYHMEKEFEKFCKRQETKTWDNLKQYEEDVQRLRGFEKVYLERINNLLQTAKAQFENLSSTALQNLREKRDMRTFAFSMCKETQTWGPDYCSNVVNRNHHNIRVRALKNHARENLSSLRALWQEAAIRCDLIRQYEINTLHQDQLPPFIPRIPRAAEAVILAPKDTPTQPPAESSYSHGAAAAAESASSKAVRFAPESGASGPAMRAAAAEFTPKRLQYTSPTQAAEAFRDLIKKEWNTFPGPGEPFCKMLEAYMQQVRKGLDPQIAFQQARARILSTTPLHKQKNPFASR